MGREEDVVREEFKTAWWDGGSPARVLELRKDQPTVYRVLLYDEQLDHEKVRAAIDNVEPNAILELPPPVPGFVDIEGHEVQLDRGNLVIRKIVGVGLSTAGWETVAIFPPGEWKGLRALKFREGK